MLFNFFFALREAGLKVGLTELLTLQEALAKHLALFSMDEFYYLSRATMVKDETHYDRFDRAFAAYFKGVEAASKDLFGEIPDEWLRKQAERLFTDEEKEKITKVATSGSAPAAPRRSATAATTPKASASAAKAVSAAR